MATDVATQITSLARQKYGEEGARVVAAILQVEGGLTGNVGDNGNAFGPFQFHTRGELPGYAKARGLSLQQAGQKARTDPLDAATWALDNYLGQTLQKGLQAGVKGPRLATYVQQYAQRSEKPEQAGAAYQSMYGSGGQEGGSDVMPREEEDKAPSAQDTAVANYEKKIAKWEEEKTAAETKLADLREKMAAVKDPTTFAGSNAVAALAAQARSYEARVNSLDNDINKAMAQMERIRTQKDQQYAQDRQRQQDARQSQQDTLANQDKALDALRDLTSLEISAGNKSYEQGLARFNSILDLAKQGTDIAYRVGQLMVQAAPRMGNRTTAKAYEALVRSYEPYLPPGTKFPEGDMFPVQPFDPQAMMAPYQPPPNMINWGEAQEGLLQARGAYDQVPDVMRQYREQALLNAVPPEEPMQAPPPEGSPFDWRGAMLNQQASAGQAPPGSSQIAPPMPAQLPVTPDRAPFPPPSEGPPGWNGQAPASNAPVPMDPEMARYAREAADRFSQMRRPTPVPSPTPVPTPQPGTLRVRTSEEIMADPTLSQEQKLAEINAAYQ